MRCHLFAPLLVVALVCVPDRLASQTFSRWTALCESVDHTAGVALGDIDGDGDLDLLFSNGRHLPEIDWIYSNDGRGNFYGRRALGNTPDPSYWLALGDIDRDGALDVVVANDSGARSQVYRNDGKGQFTPGPSLGAAQARRAVAIGDLDGDGHLDVVLVGVGQDHIYLNDGTGRTWTERPLGARQGTEGRATGVGLADIDGDGDVDIVVPGRYDAESLIFINDGNAGFAEARPFGERDDDVTSVALGDIDGDRDVDIITASWRHRHAVFVNDGKGRFSQGNLFGTTDEQAWSVVLADMDLDGDLDVLVGTSNLDFWNEDVDGDGRPDRFGQTGRAAPNRVYTNDGAGRLTPGAPVTTGTDDTRPVAVGDVDGDGDFDVVIGNDCQPNHVLFNSLRTGRSLR
jgi:hypothetical protein